jgi:hypothetical protein
MLNGTDDGKKIKRTHAHIGGAFHISTGGVYMIFRQPRMLRLDPSGMTEFVLAMQALVSASRVQLGHYLEAARC